MRPKLMLMIRRLSIPVCLALTLCAAVLAGCGDDATPATAAADRAPMERDDAGGAMRAPATRTRHESVARGIQVMVVRSPYGRILADGRARRSTSSSGRRRDTPCHGASPRPCRPCTPKPVPRTGAGADADDIGVTKRRDGRRQLTYAGRPVYYYVADAPGRVLCHDVTEFGGRWVVIRPDGTPVP